MNLAEQKDLKRLGGICVVVCGFIMLVLLVLPEFFRIAKIISENKPGLWGYPAWYVLLMLLYVTGVGCLLINAALLIFSDSKEKSRKRYIIILISVSLVRGIFYSAVIPPWQSPDEHAHFEYAALLGQLRYIPTLHDLNDEVQSQIVTSMFQYDFWQLIERQPVEVPPEGFMNASGIFEIPPTHVINNRFLYYPQVGSDPPLFYVMPALIYVGLIKSDTALQLYGMRLATVAMFVILVASVSWALRKIFPEDTFIVMETATFVAFLPMLTYMGSVLSNDILAAVFTTILLGFIVIIIRFGLSWSRVFAVCVLLMLGLLTRYTIVWIIPLLVGIGIVYGYRKYKVLRFAIFFGGTIALIFSGLFLIPSVETRYWHSISSSGNIVTNRTSLVGEYALRVQGTLSEEGVLVQDLLTQSVLALQGRQISLTAWVQSDKGPQMGWLAVGQNYKPLDRTEFVADNRWQKVDLQFFVPESSPHLQIFLGAKPGMEVYFDEITIIDLNSPESHIKFLRNGSAERISTIGEVIVVRASELLKYSGPAQRFFSVWRDNLRLLIQNPWPIRFGIQSFWGNFGAALLVPLNSSVYRVLDLVCLISAIGMVVHTCKIVIGKQKYQDWQLGALIVLGFALLLGSLVVIIPLFAMYGMWAPQGRYLFPVVLPIATFIILGLSQMIPRCIRRGLTLFVASCMIWLDYIVLRLLLNYFYGI